MKRALWTLAILSILGGIACAHPNVQDNETTGTWILSYSGKGGPRAYRWQLTVVGANGQNRVERHNFVPGDETFTGRVPILATDKSAELFVQNASAGTTNCEFHSADKGEIDSDAKTFPEVSHCVWLNMLVALPSD
jgi:hypothetical protein